MADRDSYVKTGVDVDDSSFDRLINRYKSAIARLGDMRQQLVNVDKAAQSTGRSVVSNIDKATQSIDRAEKATAKWITRLEESARKRLYGTLPSQTKTLDEFRDSLLGGAPAGKTNVSGLIGPGIGLARGLQTGNIGQIASSATRIGPELAHMGVGVGQLAKALPIAAVGVGILAAGFDHFNRTIGASAQALTAASKQLDAFFEAGEKGTTESVNKQIGELTRHKEFVDQNLEVRVNAEKKAFESAQKIVGGNVTFIGDAFGRLGFALAQTNPEIKAVLDRTQELKTESTGLGATMAGLNAAINAGITATNDAAEAEKKLSDARATRIDKEVSASVKQAELLRSGTSEQAKAILQKDKTEKEIIERAITRLESIGDKASLDKIAQFRVRLEELDLSIGNTSAALPILIASEKERRGAVGHLTDETRELVGEEGEILEARKRETEWILKAGEALNEFGDAAERIADERTLSKFREQQDFDIKRARDSAGFARKQAADDAKYYKDRGKSIAAFQAEQQKSDNEASKARLKAVADANDAQIKAAEDFAKTVRGFTMQINEAGANLDAIGVRNAKEGLKAATDEYNREKKGRDADAKKRLDEIAENAQEERDQRAADFAQQLADADEQHREQREADIAEFRERQRIEDEDRRLRLQRQQEDYTRQDAQRKAAFDKQLQNLRTQLLEPEETAKEGSYFRQRAALNNFLNGAVNDINAAKSRATAAPAPAENNRALSASVSRASPASSPSSFSRSFASGGFPPLNKAVRVGELGPETVVFKDPAQIFRAGTNVGGAQYNFNGSISVGGNPAPAEFYQMARTAFESILEEAMPS